MPSKFAAAKEKDANERTCSTDARFRSIHIRYFCQSCATHGQLRMARSWTDWTTGPVFNVSVWKHKRWKRTIHCYEPKPRI